LTNDDTLFQEYEDRIAARIKRSFRKSTLLSGIHHALSREMTIDVQLGDKILCVDDDVEIARFMARCLASEDNETSICESGEAALEEAQSGDYWMVLLDIAMPGLDGWETCTALKSNAALAGIKVFLVTAKPIDKHLGRVRECGADGYLLKPFKAEDLLGLVQGFEGRRGRKTVEEE